MHSTYDSPDADPGATRGSSEVDDLAALLPDWRVHLRARNLAPGTIISYLVRGETLLAYLREQGMPTAVSAGKLTGVPDQNAQMAPSLTAQSLAATCRTRSP